MVKLDVKIDKLSLKNPILTASGTFGYGYEYDEFFDVAQLGGIILKSVTLQHREGNDYPRIAEAQSGMLNAVGLQNKGLDYFVSEIYPIVSKINTNIIANVAGATIDDYVAVAEKISKLEHIHAIELNVSCPNVKQGGMAFGTKPDMVHKITKEIKSVYDKTLIVKLTPNVTDIVEIARAAEEAGADAVSLVNTFLGMAININNWKPMLSTITGGLSGPAMKPIALRMVWQVAQNVKIPVIGVGGITNANDVIEFLLAGATAVEIGTANIINPLASIEAIEGLKNYMVKRNIDNVNEIIGGLKNNG